MTGIFRIITTADQLIDAAKDKTARYLIIRNDISDLPSIKLQPFQSISGEFDGKIIKFATGSDGFCLSKGNELKNIRIETTPDKRAIFQDTDVESMNTHSLTRLTVVGQISFILGSIIKKGRIDISYVHVAEASTLHLTERPNQFSVDMMQGALTIWNKSEAAECDITCDISHFSCGSETKPIAGSGLVICGSSESQNILKSTIISCGHIYTKGEIGKGVANIVCAGICTGYYTETHNIINYGRITCYGGNEMGIYNWGTVTKWDITDRIETHGDNGCGIINAGNINRLTMSHPIETFGIGARGFYMFSGHLRDLQLEKVITHGDASNAIHFNKYIDRLSIAKDIITYGNAIEVKFADSIVKVSSDGICVKYGGTLRILKVSGDIITNGNNTHSIYNEAGIERAFIGGEVLAKGENSVALEVNEGFFAGENIKFVSQQWAAIKLIRARMNNCRNLSAYGKDFDILVDTLSSVNKSLFTAESLTGVFQDNVRVDYIDNLENKPDVENEKEEVIDNKFTIKTNDISPDSVEGNEIHPMSCEPPKSDKKD